MNRAHIPGFPNHIPWVYWKTCLPKFKDQEGDDAALHLVKFYRHVHKLKVEFHEDCLMKMFVANLEGRTRVWYEKLPHASIYSLQELHLVFFQNYKDIHPSLVLVEIFCANLEELCCLMGMDVYNEDVLDNEVREALSKLYAHLNKETEGNDFDGKQTMGSSLTDDDMELDLYESSRVSLLATNEMEEGSK